MEDLRIMLEPIIKKLEEGIGAIEKKGNDLIFEIEKQLLIATKERESIKQEKLQNQKDYELKCAALKAEIDKNLELQAILTSEIEKYTNSNKEASDKIALSEKIRKDVELERKMLNSAIEEEKNKIIELNDKIRLENEQIDEKKKKLEELNAREQELSRREKANSMKVSELADKEKDIEERDLDSKLKAKEVNKEYKRLKLNDRS